MELQARGLDSQRPYVSMKPVGKCDTTGYLLRILLKPTDDLFLNLTNSFFVPKCNQEHKHGIVTRYSTYLQLQTFTLVVAFLISSST